MKSKSKPRLWPSLLALLVISAFALGGLLTSAQPASAQTCMGDEGFETNPATNMTYVQGMQDAEDLNCTANDVEVASTELVSVNGQPPDPNGNECLEGEVVTVELLADLKSNSEKVRSDIGIWIANDGGAAITGSCQHFYFVAPELSDLDTISDVCRDIGSKVLFQDVPLDTPLSSLDVVCRDDDGNGFLDVGSCIGWKVPGDDQICPDDADGNGTPDEPNDFVKGTLPANKAKCRCSNIEIPIVVKKNAKIEVVKDLEPDNAPGLFNLQIDGKDEATDVGDGGTTGEVTVTAGTSQNPGDTHSVGETAGTGNDLNFYGSSISCVDDGLTTFNGGPPLTATGPGPLDVPVDPDDDIVCTITNTLPTLKLVKDVTNDDGGTAGPNDWTLSATAAAPNDGLNFSNAGGSGVFEAVFATVGYDLAESTVNGYTAGSWSCDGGTLVGSTVTLAAGEQVTCTINNDDTAPTLKLVKTVTNDDGGNNVPDDWTLSATAAAPNDGRNFSNAGGSGSFVTVFANAGYDLSESVVAGYTAGSWSCDGGTLVGSTITLGLDDEVTCTINNDDIAPTLKLVKTVTNDDGGNNVPGDWTLSASASAPNDGRNFSNAGGSGVFQTVFANAGYDLSESVLAGYTAGSWSCDGGTLVGSTVTLTEGETGVTCTINNDDVAPTLKLVKVVDNGSNPGGTAVADDWTLSASASTPNDGRNFSNAGGSGVFQTVFANAGYDLSESVLAGYQVKTDWSCDGGTLVGSTVTLTEGETGVTCTIENEAQGMVEILKLTNGAENQTMVWNFTLTGPGVDESDSSPPTTVDFGGVKLIPGEEYTLCETGIPAGWTLEWKVDTDGDGIPDTIIPHVSGTNTSSVDPATGYSQVYDPNYVAPPGQFTNDTRCVNFVVDVGETLAFQVDNQFPGGEPRTIGFWKNWNTCTGGNQAETAANNGGPAEGWFILDDLLNDPGYTIGVLQLDGADCEDAVNILDKRDLSGKKRANDAAYNLASQLLAAMVNLSAGAETCQEVVDAVNAGQTLLESIVFDGTTGYLTKPNGPQGQLYQEANTLAGTLDTYNNGDLCTP